MNIKDLIKQIATQEGLEVYSKICKVIAINEKERLVDLAPLDGSADILEAFLQPDNGLKTGVVQIPKKGSLVIATWISESAAFVSLVADPEKILIDAPEILINGGGNKGLIILDRLTTEIEKLNNNFKVLSQTIKAAVPTPNDGGAAIKTALSGITFQEADLSQVENEKVKH